MIRYTPADRSLADIPYSTHTPVNVPRMLHAECNELIHQAHGGIPGSIRRSTNSIPSLHAKGIEVSLSCCGKFGLHCGLHKRQSPSPTRNRVDLSMSLKCLGPFAPALSITIHAAKTINAILVGTFERTQEMRLVVAFDSIGCINQCFSFLLCITVLHM